MELQKKQFKYKGKTIEELQKLDIREFSNYLPARQKRTILRNFQEIENFITRAKKKISKSKRIKTHKRYIPVTPEMVGMKIQIYNGQKFNLVEITEEMLGHKFGEFSLTRAKIKHSKTGIGATKSSKAKSKK